MKFILLRVVLVALGLIVGLVSVELYLREADRRAAAQQAGLARQDTESASTEYPSATQYLAEANRYFAVHDPTGDDMVTHQRPDLDEIFQGVRVRTNHEGWRNRDVDVDKHGRRRIVVIGDSVTFGWGAAQEDIFTTRLETLFAADSRPERAIEVINLGNGGYNTTQEYAALRRYGLAYQPDMVALLYVTNDFQTAYGRDEVQDAWDGEATAAGGWRGRLLRVGQQFAEHSALLTRLIYAWRTRELSLTEKIEQRYGSVEAYWDAHPGWLRSRSALRQIAHTCREHDIPFVVFFFSFAEEFYSASLLPRVAQVGREEFFPVIDVRTQASLTGPLSSYVNSSADLHPNRLGHEVIAEVMHTALGPLLDQQFVEAQRRESLAAIGAR